MVDGSASRSAQPPKQASSMCAPCPLKWLALAGWDLLPPASHIPRREVCSRVSSTRDTLTKQWGQSKPGRATVEFFGVREKTPLAAPPPGFDHGWNLARRRSGIRRREEFI